MVAAKKYSSPSITHIKSYTIVSEVSKYFSRFEIITYLFGQVTLLLGYVLDIVSKYPLIIDNFAYVDNLFNTLVLDNFDYLKNLLVNYYNTAVTTYNTYGENFNKIYLEKVNQYLHISNSLTLAKDESKVYQFLSISNYGLVSSKNIVINNSNSLSNYLLGLINSQLEANKDGNVLVKYYTVTYNVANQIYVDLNQNYLTPIKNQTTDYVQDVASQTKYKADSYVKNLNFLKAEQAPVATVEVPVVSASA